ncbi:glycogen debranching N-terminal domain-containing protein [Microcella sp.]|uniref:glycogen debranching N-terminal domain-containing protein n=1 Tax=Microcella sp. TaxID=1913979 RepID=UPI00256AFD68|nr:glycogen debranching N-terminal domain-containing protein [Microcella sp.]MBX9472251.1 amylo-alpha-1,6-glucosidase [Microcella sp.]
MTASLQPLLNDELVVLRAPTQAWSSPSGAMGGAAIHGVYVSDVRLIRGLRVRIGDRDAEHLSTGTRGADSVRIESLLRHLDDRTPDPEVRLTLERTVDARGMVDTLTVRNRHEYSLTAPLVIELDLDATSMESVKLGHGPGDAPAVTVDGGVARWLGQSVTASVSSPDLGIEQTATGIRLTAELTIGPASATTVSWRLDADDAIGAVRGDSRPVPWSRPEVLAGDQRLSRWVDRALDDLDALRMTTAQHPEETFLAAGAPWFFTLFGRDSIWAARMMLPLGTELAGSTLRVLAGLQGTHHQPASAEEPGKIMHELRREALVIDDDITLPPLYYGTVDATPLFVCLLHDAWKWGLPDDEVRALLPHLEAALGWMRDDGDADGDGLLEYIDRSGHGLANQGWKDSGDSVQWRDGSLAEGPIALCEVQAYAYEAAMGGAALLEAFDRPGADEWRAWAARLREAFHAKFWITDASLAGALGPYPAIALDAQKRPVDTVTSNLGHLLGTGLLDAEQSALVAARLGSPELDSGYGLRTMSTDSTGYWPLSYHGGSVWTHDTAIAVLGLAREGHDEVASSLARGLLRAAEGFDYRMPELHSGDPVDVVTRPIPYPAACRPQAWSAASSVAVLTAALGLVPDAAAGTLASSPLLGLGSVAARGLRVGASTLDVGL